MTQQTSLFNASNRCAVTFKNGALVLKTPYDPALVAAVKALPTNDRRFDPTDRVWLVDPKHKAQVEKWLMLYFGESVTIALPTQTQAKKETRILEVHYIGTCKDRDGSSEAYGCDPRNNWIFAFPESVLRAWFDGTEENTTPTPEKTLYAILGVTRGAVADEIRTGYRRMAMQWHPDRCKEPNAHEVFLRIQEAYAILSDPNKRPRYDAGLALEATLQAHHTKEIVDAMATQYRSPLRCGLIMAEGVEIMGRFKVSKILVWQDIYDAYGRTLVSSWVKDAKEPTKVWA